MTDAFDAFDDLIYKVNSIVCKQRENLYQYVFKIHWRGVAECVKCGYSDPRVEIRSMPDFDHEYYLECLNCGHSKKGRLPVLDQVIWPLNNTYEMLRDKCE
jgi:Zn ribbon nucleic-acid-binding protein